MSKKKDNYLLMRMTVIGYRQVGKTSLVSRFTENSFNKNVTKTEAIQHCSKEF